MSITSQTHPPAPPTSVISPSPTPSPTLQPSQAPDTAPDPKELRRRLEKLCRNYDVDTMKVFMVVEGVGQEALHAVYRPDCRQLWEAFLQRAEACRLDLTRHDKTRDRYRHFITKVRREEQGRQWFLAVLRTLHYLGASDLSDYLTTHTATPPTFALANNTNTNNNRYNSNNVNGSKKYNLENAHSPRRHESYSHRSKDGKDDPRHRHHHHHHHQHQQSHRGGVPQASTLENKPVTFPRGKDVALVPIESLTAEYGDLFCQHLIKLFEKKLEMWFETFHSIAVRLTAHVKVAGLVRVLTGQVHALATRQGRLTALCVKVTGQDTPRPLDVAELCLIKVMVIQNGLALPDDLDLALLTLHMLPARPVLRLWLMTPSPNMEAAIRVADIDDMIDAGRLSQRHELWPDNVTTEDTANAAAATTLSDTAPPGAVPAAALPPVSARSDSRNRTERGDRVGAGGK